VIIALGEAILLVGGTFATLPMTLPRTAAFVLVSLVTVGLWWIYFDRSAEFGAQVIASSTDPGRQGRTAYTYFHQPMIAGIVATAVADELVVSHPGGRLGSAAAAVGFGGPALFLAGHALFKWSLSGHLPWQRLLAAAALAAVATPGRYAPPVAAPLVPLAAISLVAVSDRKWPAPP
jgi:low temperature requirement protein LtrA